MEMLRRNSKGKVERAARSSGILISDIKQKKELIYCCYVVELQKKSNMRIYKDFTGKHRCIYIFRFFFLPLLYHIHMRWRQLFLPYLKKNI